MIIHNWDVYRFIDISAGELFAPPLQILKLYRNLAAIINLKKSDKLDLLQLGLLSARNNLLIGNLERFIL